MLVRICVCTARWFGVRPKCACVLVCFVVELRFFVVTCLLSWHETEFMLRMICWCVTCSFPQCGYLSWLFTLIDYVLGLCRIMYECMSWMSSFVFHIFILVLCTYWSSGSMV